MATYVISDIHGEYDKFIELLSAINFKDTDTLYVLGDILDRGPHPIKVLTKLMEMPNVICLVGNHELMALECLEFLLNEITEVSIGDINEQFIENLINWKYNGCLTTISEFRKLDRDMQQEVMDYIKEFRIYEELSINNQDYLLVHAGLGGYDPGKDIEDYSLKELVWDRARYDISYFNDKIVITGHTPTQTIAENPKPGYIFKGNNHIAIDCGACFPGGRLAALCLDTGEEFYSSSNDGSKSSV